MSDVIYCLNDSIKDKTILFIQPIIRSFVSESKYTSSVDGFLVLLGTLVSRLEEAAPLLKLSDKEVLMRTLSCNEVAEALRPLVKYVDIVNRMVSTDPRHRGLRPYLSLITSYLSGLNPVDMELDITRPPLRELERMGTTRESAEPSIVYEFKPLGKKDKEVPASIKSEKKVKEAGKERPGEVKVVYRGAEKEKVGKPVEKEVGKPKVASVVLTFLFFIFLIMVIIMIIRRLIK
ncbi:MAG: hypothetical protein QXM54_03330 [Desulfurococcaceae archaeon]